jgi:small subunit ribosomal protein S19
MTRSSWKNPFSKSQIFKSIYLNSNSEKPIKIWSRSSVIFPLFVGKIFSIYNGKKFVNVQISEEMIGFKLGELVSTRKKTIHKKK